MIRISSFKPFKRFAALALLALCSTAGLAQTKLKWAHVYETSEPYHKQALWAAEEIKKRSNGKYLIDVFPASTLGKETDINQGLTLGTVDIIYTGMAFAGRAYPPLSIASGPFEASIATAMVRARSEAEMPVVTPSRASIEMVKAVCMRASFVRVIGVRPSCSTRADVMARQTRPRKEAATCLLRRIRYIPPTG